MKVYLENNGCIKRNSEVIKLQKYLTVNNHELVPSPNDAEYIVVSTCAFKEQEEEFSIARIKYLKDIPAKLLVIGCLPEIAPTKFGEFKKIDSLPPKDIDQIDKYFPGTKVKYAELDEVNILPPSGIVSTAPVALKKFFKNFEVSRKFGLRIWRYLEKKVRVILNLNPPQFYISISRGCLGDCSYCAIKRAIGMLQSRSLDVIVKQFHEGINNGFTDFIILGDDVGAYGIDIGSSFPAVLTRLIDETNSLDSKRNRGQGIGFHIHEIHPKWLLMYKEQLLSLIGTKLIRAIICPVESGNDRILKLMRRHYSRKEIYEFFQKARELNPRMKLSTHLMIGFPSETEQEFEDSLELIGKIRFDRVTVFPYDPREGTDSTSILPVVEPDVIQKRLSRAQEYFSRQGIKMFLSCPE